MPSRLVVPPSSLQQFRHSLRHFASHLSRCCAAFGALLLLATVCVPAASAQVSATLTGTITDQSNAAVVGAGIAVRNVETGEVRSTQTDAVGRYQVFALPVGVYEVSVKKQGFAEQVRTGIHLVVGQKLQQPTCS